MTLKRAFREFCLMVTVITAVLLVVVGCSSYPTTSTQIERSQQESGVQAIVRNQPVPDLGGYSFERSVVIQLEIARNKGNVSTYSYLMTIEGRIIEICPSIGFPIPYATQLTNPYQVTNGGFQTGTGSGNVAIGNPEPNSLYPPASAAGTWIMCVNPDGSTSPAYFEPEVFALPFRIKSDIQLQRADSKPSSINITK